MGSIGKQKPYTILVAGAGIGGLSASIALVLKGLDVTILEGKSELNKFGASISISPHVVRVIKSYGLGQQFKPNVTENSFIDLRNGADNSMLGAILENEANTTEVLYSDTAWNIYRADYQ